MRSYVGLKCWGCGCGCGCGLFGGWVGIVGTFCDSGMYVPTDAILERGHEIPMEVCVILLHMVGRGMRSKYVVCQDWLVLELGWWVSMSADDLVHASIIRIFLLLLYKTILLY